MIPELEDENRAFSSLFPNIESIPFVRKEKTRNSSSKKRPLFRCLEFARLFLQLETQQLDTAHLKCHIVINEPPEAREGTVTHKKDSHINPYEERIS